MANVFVNEDSLSDIADAIRSKLNVQTTYKPGEMAAAIESISGGGITPTGTKSITANGTYDVTSYASAEVNVPTGGSTLQAKTNINPTTSSQTITADSGYDGLSSVQINAMPTQTLPSSTSASGTGTQKATIGKSTSSQYLNIPTGYNGTAQYYNILPMDLQSLSITENGTYTASTYDLDGFSSVTVNVSGGGGGGTSTGGTFTMDSNGKTVSLTVPSGITNFVFYATDFNEGISDAGGWITVGGIWFNSIGKSFCRYNNNNDTTSYLTVTVTGTTLTLTAQYNLRVEKTYKWYAW